MTHDCHRIYWVKVRLSSLETKLEKPGSDGSGVSRGAIFATLDKGS